MQAKLSKEIKGLRVEQKVGRFIEVFFDFAKLPKIDVTKDRFVLEVRPKSRLIKTEWATPNGAGPLFLNLEEGQEYLFILHITPHPTYQVESSFEPAPMVEVIFDHPSLIKLVWGGIDLQKLHKQ